MNLPCGDHSGVEKRLDRAEQDIQTIFGIFNKKNNIAWAFVGTAVLSFLTMAVNVIMFFHGGK